MKILVNQLGYDIDEGALNGSCRAVLQSIDGSELPESVLLRDSEGFSINSFSVESGGAVEGWKNRLFGLVEFQAPEGGPYTLEAVSGELRAVSAPFQVGVDLEANSTISDILFGIASGRSAGISDNQDRKIPFFGDRKGTVDVHGGWYDASGDTSKYLSHLSYANFMNPQQTPLVVWCLIDAYEHLQDSRFALEERLNLRFLEEAAWGADFLMRMQDSEGYFYMTVFDTWSKDLDERKICAYRTQNGILTEEYQAGYRQGGGIAIAALARTSARLRNLETPVGSYGPDEYLEAAKRGWRHLEKHNLEYLDDGRENIIDDYCALLAAVEIAAASTSPDSEIRTAIQVRVSSLLNRWDDSSGCFRADDAGKWSWFHASDEALPLIALMRALETNLLDEALADKVGKTVQRAFEAEMERASKGFNPFSHPRHFVRMPGKKDSRQFFYPHENPSGYWWQGENARLASWTAAGRRYGLLKPSDSKSLTRLAEFSDAQISWILGLNPFDACMLQGQGKNNPPYEWDHFNLPGGVANGITAGMEDEDDIAFMPPEAAESGDHSWRWGEQWIPHAAWLLLAAAWSVPPGE